MLNLAICDDDKAVCSQMEDILEKLGQTFSVEIKIEVFFSGEECA